MFVMKMMAMFNFHYIINVFLHWQRFSDVESVREAALSIYDQYLSDMVSILLQNLLRSWIKGR